MYVHEVYSSGSRTQVIHAEETVRPSGLVVVRRLGAIHVAHLPLQSTNLHLPQVVPQEMKPEDFKEPIEIPKVRFTADTLIGFRDVGKAQIPKAVLELGSIAQTGFLLRGNELPDGTLVPTADETEIKAMREIFNSFKSVLANPSLADMPDTPSTGTGFYL